MNNNHQGIAEFELVMTSKGLRYAKDVKVGDLVYTKSGYKRVIGCDKIESLYFVDVKTKRGYKIKCSSDQLFSFDGFHNKSIEYFNKRQKIAIVTNSGGFEKNLSPLSISKPYNKGHNSSIKTADIPGEIITGDINVIEAYVSGCVDSIGECYPTGVRITSNSEIYINQIANMMKAIGFFPLIKEEIVDGVATYNLSERFRECQAPLVSSRKYKDKFHGFASTGKIATVYHGISQTHKTKNLRNPNPVKWRGQKGQELTEFLNNKSSMYAPVIYDTIVSIDKLNFFGALISLKIEDENSFMCNGFLVGTQ